MQEEQLVRSRQVEPSSPQSRMLASCLLPLGRPCLALRLAPATFRLLSSGAARPASELAQLRKKTGYSLSICKKVCRDHGNTVG